MPIRPFALQRLAHGGGALAAMLLLSCGSRATGAFDAWSTAGCARHDQCADAEICLQGTCTPGDRDATLQIDANVAQARFDNPDGSCTGAHRACGPWLCVAGQCVDPILEGYDAPTLGEIAYWDGACGGDDDCGPWDCAADGWCRPAELGANVGWDEDEDEYDDGYDGYEDEYDGYAYGDACSSHGLCGAGNVCIWPGNCRPEIPGEPFAFDLAINTSYVRYADNSCNYDADCGMWGCHEGYCAPWETLAVTRPTIREVTFYDASCNDDSECGSWVCPLGDGFCRPPDRFEDYHGVADNSLAHADYLAGRAPTWQQAVEIPRQGSALGADDDERLFRALVGPGDGAELDRIFSTGDDEMFGSGGLGLRGTGLTGGGGGYDEEGTSGLGGFGVGSLHGGGSVAPAHPDPAAFPDGYLYVGDGDDQTCQTATDCRNGRACLPDFGVCAGPPSDTPVVTAGIPASRWFRNADGTCTTDTDCAAWACDGNQCVPAEQIGLVPPLYRNIRFNDFSCLHSNDCGGWTCAGGFCHDPQRVR